MWTQLRGNEKVRNPHKYSLSLKQQGAPLQGSPRQVLKEVNFQEGFQRHDELPYSNIHDSTGIAAKLVTRLSGSHRELCRAIKLTPQAALYDSPSPPPLKKASDDFLIPPRLQSNIQLTNPPLPQSELFARSQMVRG